MSEIISVTVSYISQNFIALAIGVVIGMQFSKGSSKKKSNYHSGQSTPQQPTQPTVPTVPQVPPSRNNIFR